MITSLDIKNECNEHFGLNIAKNTRTRPHPYMRSVYYQLCRVFTNESLQSIGDNCGGLDHATVLNGLKKYEDWKDQSFFKSYKNGYYKVYAALEKKIQDKLNRRKFSTLDQMHEHYKSRFNVLMNKNVRVRNKMNELNQVDVIPKIACMDDRSIEEFKAIANEFYLRKKKQLTQSA